MHSLDPVPAIRRIETNRDDLCALDVVGHLTSADLENAYGLLDAAYVEHPVIDLLVRLGGYDGFDWESVFTPSTLKGKRKALRNVRRYAIVGGPAWIPTMLGVFAPVTSVESRHFDASDEASAWAWLDARPLEDAA